MQVNGYDNRIVGVYTSQSQLDLDKDKLKTLGFTDIEIDTLEYIVFNGGKVTNQSLIKYGATYEQAKRLKYMYDICVGKVIIDSVEDLCKHLKRMSGSRRKIGITDFPVSRVNRVPRKCVVAGIKDSTFSIYNSSNYGNNKDKAYDVTNVTTTRIHIVTNKKPVLKYKQPKQIEGIIEILNVREDKKVEVAINKKYAKLLNRFVIVAGLRKPEMHNGLIEIISIEGTKIYVYAQSIGSTDRSLSSTTTRVYAYGYYEQEIDTKLKQVSSWVYKNVCGVYASIESANQDFRILDIEYDEDIEIE